MIDKRTIIPIILLALIAVPALCIGEAEASSDQLELDTGSLETGSFDTRNYSDVKITIRNDTTTDAEVRVWITYQNESKPIGEQIISVEMDSSAVASINIGFENQGIKYLTIHAESETEGLSFPSDQSTHNFTIHVSQSVWSNAITYVAIIAVVAIVAIAIFLRQRSAPKVEPELTFTELEELRRTGQVESRRSGRSGKAPATDRRRYEGNKRRKK